MSRQERRDEELNHLAQMGRGDWEAKLIRHHIMKIPKEHFYGTLGLELTAQPIGRPFGEGCYQR